MESKKTNNNHISRLLIQYFRKQERVSTTLEIDDLWNKIEHRAKKERRVILRHRRYITATGIAAMIAIVFGIRNMYIHNNDFDYILTELEQQPILNMNTKEVLLVLSQGKEVEVATDSKVTYSKDGKIVVDAETVESVDRSNATDKYNQLIVPKGKRSHLILSDGSKLWVNSGSRVIFPKRFSEKRREIYVDGEVYLEVFHDESSPFIVKTENFDVKVLGTSFNVCAYKGLKTSTVVLVDGVVDVNDTKEHTLRLKPNELVSINESGIGAKQNVDVCEYMSWKDGLLMLHEEPVSDVFTKLNLYYGATIIFDESVKDVCLSGKLDLKDKIEDIIRLIAKTAPIKYEIQDDKIIITKE